MTDDSKALDNLMHENRVFPPPASVSKRAHISSFSQYEELYRRSLDDSDAFWLEQAESLDWMQKPTQACQWNWDSAQRQIEHTWFADGQLNVTTSCLDRHARTQPNKTAIIWQGEKDEEVQHISYSELLKRVCQCANSLKELGVEKGDRVCLYLPMVPELAIAMLACARIGAIHSIVFGGFSSNSLQNRINDSSCKVLITANYAYRGAKGIPFKEIVDRALEDAPSIEKVLVVKRDDTPCAMQEGRDLWYHEEVDRQANSCEPEVMNAEDPLFILYTSGSTGKPKGVVHTQAGYLLHTSLTHKLVFDIHEDDIYWCTADIGWITGHSYIVYGPLANGCTTLMFEGIPTYPDPGRFWQVVEKHKATVFYTAPTAIRALIGQGEEWPAKYDLCSLRIIGTVGEPINPEAWMWYHKNIGKERCPIVDTWWQTETGGMLLTPLPGSHTLKPGCATRPFFGVDPIVVNSDGRECATNEGGQLCIKRPWPGIMRTMWGDHERFVDTYFSQHNNLYFTADGCRVDEDGDYWLMGRIDDIVNVSGHNIGTAEVESALVSHPLVAEAAVVPMPHPVKGQALYAFVTLMDHSQISSKDEMVKELVQHVREEIGPIAAPERIQFAPALPKTRSGKIMRRILRKIVEKQTDQLGDTSTLADPGVVDALVKGCEL